MKQVTWLPVCNRCDRAKAPRGCVPADDSEVDDYCTRQCTGYEEYPHPIRLPSSKWALEQEGRS